MFGNLMIIILLLFVNSNMEENKIIQLKLILQNVKDTKI